MATSIPVIFFKETDDLGAPLSNGKLYAYEAGTDTPKVTYTEPSGTVASAFPIVLNSAGRCSVWLASGGYKFVLKDANDNVIWTKDGIGLSASDGIFTAVTDISALRDLASGYAEYVYIGYSHVLADNASDTFRWDATSTAADDDGTVIIPSSNPASGRWIRIIGDHILPQWWGAIGDGETDCRDAIQKALNYATTNGGTVRLIGGNYSVVGSITLKRDLNFIGEPNAYILATANSQKIFVTTTQTSRFKMSRIGMVNRGGFTNVVGIEGVGTRHNVVFEELYFESLGTGMRMKQLCWDTTARNCYAEACDIGFEVTDSSHQFMFDRCTALNSTLYGFYVHGENTDIEPYVFKTMFLQCLAQSSGQYGIYLKNCGSTSIIGGYGEANVLCDIIATGCLYLTTDNFYGGGDIGGSHIQLINCEAAQLNDVVCPGVRSVGTFNVDGTNKFCNGFLSRATSNNLLSGVMTGLKLQENTNGEARLGNVGHNGTKIYGVIETINSAAKHYHSLANNHNDKNDVTAFAIDCRSAYDIWRKGVRGGETFTLTNPEDGQFVYLILRGASDMGDRPPPIVVGGYNINMGGAAANQNTIIGLEYDHDYGWILKSESGWYQYGNRAADAEGLRLRSGSSKPATGTWKLGDIEFNNAITPTNGIHGWKTVQSGTFGTFSATATASTGSPILSAVSNFTGLHRGDFVAMTDGFAGVVAAQVLTFDSTAQTITLDTNAVSGAPCTVAHIAPIFERFGRVLDLDFTVTYAQASGTNEIKVENTDTSSTANAKLHAVTTGDGGGNPSVHCEIPGFGSISLGLDNAKTNNPGILAYASILTTGILAELYPAANGGVQWKVRNQDAMGADVTPSSNILTLGTDGNYFHVLGSGNINLMNSSNWQAGARVSLTNTAGSITYKHNQAASGSNKPFWCQIYGTVGDVSCSQNETHIFIYDGTYWRLVS